MSNTQRGFRPDPSKAPEVPPPTPGKSPDGERPSLMMDIFASYAKTLPEHHPEKLLERIKALESRVRELEDGQC